MKHYLVQLLEYPPGDILETYLRSTREQADALFEKLRQIYGRAADSGWPHPAPGVLRLAFGSNEPDREPEEGEPDYDGLMIVMVEVDEDGPLDHSWTERHDEIPKCHALELHKSADEIMGNIWQQWSSFYLKHFRGPGIKLSHADQLAFFEIAQPILRQLCRERLHGDAQP